MVPKVVVVTFSGIMGEVFIDSIGDKIADYSVRAMQDFNSGSFNVSENIEK